MYGTKRNQIEIPKDLSQQQNPSRRNLDQVFKTEIYLISIKILLLSIDNWLTVRCTQLESP